MALSPAAHWILGSRQFGWRDGSGVAQVVGLVQDAISDDRGECPFDAGIPHQNYPLIRSHGQSPAERGCASLDGLQTMNWRYQLVLLLGPMLRELVNMEVA